MTRTNSLKSPPPVNYIWVDFDNQQVMCGQHDEMCDLAGERRNLKAQGGKFVELISYDENGEAIRNFDNFSFEEEIPFLKANRADLLKFLGVLQSIDILSWRNSFPSQRDGISWRVENAPESGKNIMNPTTIIDIAEGGYMEMDTVQIQGVDNTIRTTKGKLGDKATLKITERIMTDGDQYAETRFEVDLDGEESGTHVISRSVARENSKQLYVSNVNGNKIV